MNPIFIENRYYLVKYKGKYIIISESSEFNIVFFYKRQQDSDITTFDSINDFENEVRNIDFSPNNMYTNSEFEFSSILCKKVFNIKKKYPELFI